MVVTSAQSTIRGIDIDKLAKGFADEELVLKNFVTVSPTAAREIRWYSKTSGFVDTTDSQNITASQIANVPQGALPAIAEQSWTRNTSYVRKYFVGSPLLTYEDINDSDINLLTTTVRDLTRAVQNQVEKRIYTILTDSSSSFPSLGVATNIGTSVAVGTGWDDTTNGNPILDILSGSAYIRSQGYEINNLVLYINPAEYKNLMNFLISTKGSSIPAFSSELAQNGVLMRILTARVVVSQNATTDYALLFVPGKACTWRSFMPISADKEEFVGRGVKVYVWEEGEAYLTDPKASFLITDTVT